MGAIETTKFVVNLLLTVVSAQIFKKDAIQTAPQSLINLLAAIIFCLESQAIFININLQI